MVESLRKLSDDRVSIEHNSILADRTDGRACATALRPSVCLSSVCDVCIVAKRCVLEQKLLLIAYMKSTVLPHSNFGGHVTSSVT